MTNETQLFTESINSIIHIFNCKNAYIKTIYKQGLLFTIGHLY